MCESVNAGTTLKARKLLILLDPKNPQKHRPRAMPMLRGAILVRAQPDIVQSIDRSSRPAPRAGHVPTQNIHTLWTSLLITLCYTKFVRIHVNPWVCQPSES